MKRMLKYALLITIVLLSSLNAQVVEIDGALIDETSSGARASAMGQAYTALANDATALAWNPAGLCSANRASAMISTDLSFGNIEIIPPTGLQTAETYKTKRSGSIGLNFVGFTIPLRAKNTNLVGAIAIRNITNLNCNVTWPGIGKDNSSKPDTSDDRSGGIFSLSTGMGAELLSNLSAGVSLNFITGNQTSKTSIVTNANSEDAEWQNWKNKFSGFSIDFGIRWEASQVMAFASRFTFPYSIHLSKLEYSDSNNKKEEYQTDESLSKPFSCAFGMAYRPAPEWTFSVDYLLRPWKKAIVKYDRSEVSRLFANANSIRFGSEFIAHSEAFDLPLRLGFFTNPEQVFDFNAANPHVRGKQRTSVFITGGLGIATNKTMFDLALDYSLLSYKTDYLNIGKNPFDIKEAKFRILLAAKFMLQ